MHNLIKKTKYSIFLFFLIFNSCKTCITCDCIKDGVKTVEEECSYTNDKSGTARNYNRNLMERKGYDECLCTY